MMRIILPAALPYEYRPLLKLLRPWRRIEGLPLPVFCRHMGCAEVFLAETGMGAEQAEGVLTALAARWHPDLLCSIGFAGALSGDYPVGSVCLGRSFEWHNPECRDACELRFPLSSVLQRFCEDHGISPARVVTAAKPESKRALAALYAPAVMDMESYPLARWSQERGVPFLTFRAISDGAGEEIDFDLGGISDAAGRVRIGKVIRSVLASPRLIGTFARLGRQSHLAAGNLARVVAAFVSQPPEAIRGCLGLLQPREN